LAQAPQRSFLQNGIAPPSETSVKKKGTMALPRGTAGKIFGMLASIGMLSGLLLLGFAGYIAVSSGGGSQVAASVERKLQSSFGYMTSTRPPSSFDSSDSSSSSDISLEPSKSFESGSLDSSDWNMIYPKLSAGIGSSMGPLTIWLILQAIWAILYNKLIVSPLKETGTLDERMDNAKMDDIEGQNDFNNGFCECTKDGRIQTPKWVFLETLFCPMVRMAHTNAVSGVCAFWETLWCWCCCSWLTIGIGPCCLVIWWRLRLKNIMKVEESVLHDFCGTMLCPMISLCQMSTAVDTAMGYQVTGCCEYTPFHNVQSDMN